MSDALKIHAVIPAAGAGARMGADTPKQYLELAGKTVLEYSLGGLLACPRIAEVVLVLSREDRLWPPVHARLDDTRVTTTTGGAKRCDSVLNGLDHLAGSASESDWVLVHDAARPCLRLADIEVLLAALEDDPVGGLLGLPATDTMKRVDAKGLIKETPAREELWHALTPQMFRLGALRSALQAANARGVQVTDEASAMELAGHRPRMVRGHSDNIKITRPGDLQLAEFYLQSRRAK